MAKQDKVSRFIESKPDLSLKFEKKKKVKITDKDGNRLDLVEFLERYK